MHSLALLLLFSAPLLAQYPQGANALRWNGVAGGVGPFCWGFSCTPVAAAVLPGESGTVFVRSEWGDAYVLGLSLSATRCLAVPGLGNFLAMDDPFALWRVGVCGSASPILSCPGGYDNVAVTVPAFLPPGFRFTLQGVTGPGPSYSFTQPIDFVVR